MLYRLLVLCVGINIIFIQVCGAQEPEPYHEPYSEQEGVAMPLFKNRNVQIAVPLMAAGGVMFGNDVAFRDMRNDFLGSWRYHYDDYLQYSPAMVALGLKAFGVEGRSSWGRMGVSAAFSVVGTVALANGTKALQLRTRPDGSNRKSFPSGHTATAFASATMLHKEYGTTVSPWFSVGGYAVATATGMSRMLNNKHWMSDVLAGAGIGIFATELGYYLADMIFRERGLLSDVYRNATIDNRGCPSFVGVVNGANFTVRNGFSGVRTGIEGAWFPNQRMGFGGQIDVSGNQAAEFMTRYRQATGGGDPAGDFMVYHLSFQAGAYGSMKVGTRWLFMGKLLAGTTMQQDALLTATTENGGGADGSLTIGYPQKLHPTFGMGLSATFVANDHLGIRMFADTRYVVQEATQQYGKTELIPIAIGISFDALLW